MRPAVDLETLPLYVKAGAILLIGPVRQDGGKVSSRVTSNFGLRWDDYGNPYSRLTNTAFGNFLLGPGQTEQEQIASGIVVRHNHALNRAISDVFSPRGGVAWDTRGDGKWLVKGGAEFFHNWPTLANLQDEFRGNPPGNIFPTFYGGQTPEPIFGYGTYNSKPYNFTYPELQSRSLNAAGGITGLQFTNLPDGNFGKATGEGPPRFIQLGGNLTF